MLNKMCNDFHRNILKNVEDITKPIRVLVRTFGQCITCHSMAVRSSTLSHSY